jgi:hypothetical protein
LVSLTLVTLILCGCAWQAAATVSSASSEGVPHSATPVPPPTQVTLLESTVLLRLPDPLSERLAYLDAGSFVLPQAKYKDFAKVQTERGTEGFVPLQSLSYLPSVPDIDPSQLPWRSVNVISHFTVDPDVHLEVPNTLIVDNSDYSYYNDRIQLTLSSVNSPFRLTFRISTSDGFFGSLKLKNRPNEAAQEWWKGIHRVDYVTYQGELWLHIRDGITEGTVAVVDLHLSDKHQITAIFHDPYGKRFTITDENGRSLADIDVTQLTQVSLADGLFPDRQVYVGRVASPHSNLVISDLELSVQPSGEWQPSLVNNVPTLRDFADQRHVSTGTLL